MTEEAPPATADTGVIETTEITQPSFNIPDEYKSEAWTGKIKSEADLWKYSKNTTSLIGKKQVIPDHTTASDEELEQYYSNLRPKEKTDYQFGEGVSEEIKSGYSDLLFDAGISVKQAEKLVKNFEAFQSKIYGDAFDTGNLKTVLSKTFANAEEQKQAAIALKSHLSEEEHAALLDKLPNQQVALMHKLALNLQKKLEADYGVRKESGAAIATASTAKSAPDYSGYSAEYAELIKRPFNLSDENRLKAKYNIA
jgi:hypothetical protein